MGERTVEPESFMDLGDPAVALKSMRGAVELLLKEERYPALLIILVCFIDALNDGGSPTKYARFLKRHFRALCAELEPKKFYEKFRSPIVHRFKPAKGYAIAEDHELKGAYFGKLGVRGRSQSYGALNIDRFAADVLRYIDWRLKRLSDPSTR